MANSMVHWNGSQLAAIDIETTGLTPGWHEIVQLCILPLDSNICPRKDVIPFDILMKPENPERADKAAMKVNKLSLYEVAQRGFDPECAKDLFEKWFAKLGLPINQYGKSKRLILVGKNLGFDIPFIKLWLGADYFDDYFDGSIIDVASIARYINDRDAFHNNTVTFPKLTLGSIAARLNLKVERQHDALEDCLVTASVYQRLCRQGLLG